jgi:ABC-type antimicrobial peptide transport system permease subunit
VYIPYPQQGAILPAVSLLVEGERDRVAEAVSELVAAVTPDVDWSPVVPYVSYVSAWYAPLRFQLLMIGVLAFVGLLLASLGLYSLMAYQVAIDRKELGIRKALGARDGSLVLGVVARGMAMAAAGAVVGLALWYRLLPATRDLVQGIDSAGYVVPLSVALVVGGSCVLATLGPALRATRVDPVVTLKAD